MYSMVATDYITLYVEKRIQKVNSLAKLLQ